MSSFSSTVLVDENIHHGVVLALREAGVDVVDANAVVTGASDDYLLEWASRERWVLVTGDLDFPRLIYAERRTPPLTLIVERRQPCDPARLTRDVLRVLRLGERMHNRIVVLDAALALMKDAADHEDRADKSAVKPGPIKPARELLGEMLMESKRPAEALAAFEAVLGKEPKPACHARRRARRGTEWPARQSARALRQLGEATRRRRRRTDRASAGEGVSGQKLIGPLFEGRHRRCLTSKRRAAPSLLVPLGGRPPHRGGLGVLRGGESSNTRAETRARHQEHTCEIPRFRFACQSPS